MNIPTASFLIIGDEILSGRIQDKNAAYLANFLNGLGIDLIEVRIVPDQKEAIVSAVNELRAKATYLFTTGGIGSTHDDITADCIAEAFGLPIDHDPRAVKILQDHYGPHQLNEARLRMARIPQGADLIPNSVSKAPGFIVGNVFVMAGVPQIMQVMLDEIAPRLTKGIVPHVVTLDTGGLKEGDYAADLRELATRYPTVSVGSYPRFTAQGVKSTLVLRSRDEGAITSLTKDIQAMLLKLGQD
jgi:molybdenum cofactor synthesis domain-containing protein